MDAQGTKKGLSELLSSSTYDRIVKSISDDSPVLLTKNEITAIKKLVFSVVRKTLKIDNYMNVEFDGCDVDLAAVLVWAIREQRLISSEAEDVEFNIKLDGRPLRGTLDYKALLLLLNKKGDENFTLGGKGYGVECCAYLDAIRVSD
ncbi:hypothetical protein P5673_014155 [Acropora cervicornis]|uniref:Uncharacterized protein n=1 Tax=Acropora cervicornis TaxID=6130 RepID=A0AAD9V6G4_ACRCE|nr:hypothetical protein P5673_014155 [Acropora cervicornis]